MINKALGALGAVSRVGKLLAKDVANGAAAGIVNSNVSEINSITTFIGTFVYQNIKGKIARSVTFSTGSGNSRNNWMEDAFYAILYTYNNLKRQSNLDLVSMIDEGSEDKAVYYRLGDGIHHLKYRNFDIMVFINSSAPAATPGGYMSSRSSRSCTYTISTFSLNEEFVTQFEKDMIRHRDDIMRFKTGLGTISIYKDSHESDGWTYWDKMAPISRRGIRTVYLEPEVKTKLVDTINRFFSEKKYYADHGIAHNLKILLYGPAGTGKDTIAKMIASEWHRNIYYATGGKGGRFVPDALTSRNVTNPLFMVSDIDRYPFLINDELPVPEGAQDSATHQEENKQTFAHMINALDGVMSGEDRIIIMTTNHIEKFSATFLRPGRIDLVMEIGRVKVPTFRRFTYDFYGKLLPATIKLKRDDISVPELQADVVFSRMPYGEFITKYVK